MLFLQYVFNGKLRFSFHILALQPLAQNMLRHLRWMVQKVGSSTVLQISGPKWPGLFAPPKANFSSEINSHDNTLGFLG